MRSVIPTFWWRMCLKWSSHSWSFTLSEWASVTCKHNRDREHEWNRTTRRHQKNYCWNPAWGKSTCPPWSSEGSCLDALVWNSCLNIQQSVLPLMTTAWPRWPYWGYKWCDQPGAASQGPGEGRCTAVQQHLKAPAGCWTNKHTDRRWREIRQGKLYEDFDRGSLGGDFPPELRRDQCDTGSRHSDSYGIKRIFVGCLSSSPVLIGVKEGMRKPWVILATVLSALIRTIFCQVRTLLCHLLGGVELERG